jgi:hypothetical protein
METFLVARERQVPAYARTNQYLDPLWINATVKWLQAGLTVV